MSYLNYEKGELIRPISHSPPSSHFQQQYFNPPHYQKPGAYQKWGSSRKYFPQPHNYKKPYVNYNNRNNHEQSNFSNNRSFPNEHKTSIRVPQKIPLIKHPPEKRAVDNDISYRDSYVNEAMQTYENDRVTIAQVTQMLINQDKDLEDRLLKALKGILVEVKNKHEKHIEYLESTLIPPQESQK